MIPDLATPDIACGQQFPIAVVAAFLTLVLRCAASLRCAARVLDVFGPMAGCDTAPHWLTGRLWLLRVGLAALWLPKVIADDWVWMIDHSIQIGTTKCLVILGIRLSDLPLGRPLSHEDMEPIALEPMNSSNKDTVAACLKATVPRTGVPRAILDDHGADLHGGVEIFRRDYPEVCELYDVKHKAACLLKSRLEGDVLEGIRVLVGADEVPDSANGVGVLGAAEPAVQGAVHERRCPGGLGACGLAYR